MVISYLVVQTLSMSFKEDGNICWGLVSGQSNESRVGANS